MFGGIELLVSFVLHALCCEMHPTESLELKNWEECEMDWRVLLTTFGVIFLAEMGDKTQLAAMTMAAETKKPLAVFIGAAWHLLQFQPSVFLSAARLVTMFP